jgi:hypothetical protein
MLTQVIGAAGHGGSSRVGDGGVGPITSSTNGGAAGGYGAGGAGAILITSGLRSGGDGSPGLIVIEEYS